MPLEGRISVDVGFTDTSDTGGAQSLKRISLVDSSSYTTGKVAILTGTAGTAAVSFGTIGATTYRNAAGSLVTFSAISRVAFSWSGSSGRQLAETGDSVWSISAKDGEVALTRSNTFTNAFEISAGVGTGTYTIVLWGEA